MKTNFKRLFALFLTLCMLATLMVPVAFAEDEAVESTSANVAETYPIRLKDMTHTDPTTAEGIDALLVKTGSQSGTTYKQGLSLSDSTIVKAYPATLNWKYYANSDELIYRNDYMWQARMSGWGAIQIRVTKAGVYSLNVTTDRTVDNDTTENSWTSTNTTWTGKIVAYIIPLTVVNDTVGDVEATETETVEQLAIESLMTDDYCVGTVSVAADQTDITFAKTRMDAGEYVVVLDNGKQVAFSFSELSLLGDPYEMEEVASYALRPYDMTNTDPATYAGTYNADLVTSETTTTTDETTGEEVTTTTYTYNDYVSISAISGNASRYETLGWRYLSATGQYRARKGVAYQHTLKTAGDKLAIKLNVPASGEMYLSLTTDKDTPVEGASWTNSATSWTGDVTAWLVPLADYVDIATAAVDANSIGTKKMLVSETTVTFDKTYLEVGEYVLIYSANKDTYAVCEATLSKVAGSDLPESEMVTGTVATYEFQLYTTDRYANMFNGSNKKFNNNTALAYEGAYEAGEQIGTVLKRDYAAGIINWKYIEHTLDAYTVEGGDKRGLRMQMDTGTTEAPASGYMAFYLNVPATGVYNVDISCSNSKCALEVYMLDASAAGNIAANLTEENLAASFAKSAAYKGFRWAMDAGENIIVLKMVDTVEKTQCFLKTIELSVPDETVTYNFGLSNDKNFITALREAVGDETAEPKTSTLRKWTYTVTAEDGTTSSVEFNPYTTIASLFAAGSMNWALDASSGDYADTLQEDGTYKYSSNDMQNFRGGNNLRICMETDEVSYAGLRILVPTAGTYNITTTITGFANLYLIKAPNAYSSYSSRLYAGHETRAALRDLIAVAEPFAAAADSGSAVGSYTFDQPGEYILAIQQPEAKSTNLYLTSVVMEPVVEGYIADGVGYESFEDAVENAAESITLLQNTQAGDVVVPAGVTVDLNGYMLYATSVDATAPGAQIIDVTDGESVIRGNIEFNEANAQLPLYDIDADGYRLYNVDVVSSATTGTGASSKYWFKVSFSNADALDLIGLNTELRIMASMTGVYKDTYSDETLAGQAFAADAYADVTFSNTWADSSTSYIIVSAVGSGINSFRLSPAVTANGVVISGSAMSKGTA